MASLSYDASCSSSTIGDPAGFAHHPNAAGPNTHGGTKSTVIATSSKTIAGDLSQSHRCYSSQPLISPAKIFSLSGFSLVAVPFILLRKPSVFQRKVLSLMDYSIVAVSYTTLRKPQIGGETTWERVKVGEASLIFIQVIIQIFPRGIY